MIGRVGSTFQSLQELQAARSFQAADKSASVFRQALMQELQEAEPQVSSSLSEESGQFSLASTPVDYTSVPTRREPPRPQAPSPAPLDALVHEVRQIAEASGYIGVTQQDVLRAYHSGQSFLADYKV